MAFLESGECPHCKSHILIEVKERHGYTKCPWCEFVIVVRMFYEDEVDYDWCMLYKDTDVDATGEYFKSTLLTDMNNPPD